MSDRKRIDIENMKAVHIDFDHDKLRSVAQGFARDHGLTLPDGMKKNRGKDRFNDRDKTENLPDKQQQERSGISKEERRRAITEAWRESTDADSFVGALEKRGYYFARGDSAPYVVVDIYGEIHSLARQIDGVKTPQLRQRFSAYKMDRLPSAAAAQDFARKQAAERLKQAERETEKSSGKSLKEVFQENAARQRAGLEAMHKRRREDLDRKRQTVITRHREETAALRQMQKEEAAGVEAQRRQRQPKGLAAFLSRITGIQAIAEYRHRKQDFQRAQEHRQQRSALARRHRSEMTDFAHHEHALGRVEKRELRSLRTELRRDQFRVLAAPTREQRIAQKERDLKENSRDITAPPPVKKPERTKDSLAETFRKSAEQDKQKPTTEKITENAADITKPSQPPAQPQKQQEPDRQSLKEAFQRRAAQKRSDRDRDDGRDKHHHRPAPDPFRFPGR